MAAAYTAPGRAAPAKATAVTRPAKKNGTAQARKLAARYSSCSGSLGILKKSSGSRRSTRNIATELTAMPPAAPCIRRSAAPAGGAVPAPPHPGRAAAKLSHVPLAEKPSSATLITMNDR